MLRWVITQLGWLIVLELVCYRMAYSLCIGILITTLDKFGERK